MADDKPNKTPTTRSPNSPVIALESALKYARKLRDGGKGHWVPMKTAVETYWGMKLTSSFTTRLMGALRAFGLIEIRGKGSERQLRVIDDAGKILTNHSDRASLLHAAALEPGIYSSLWEHYAHEGGLPPDPILKEYLLWHHEPRFNEQSVEPFIENFRATLSFAGIEDDGTLDEDENGEDAESPPDKTKRTPIQPTIRKPPLRPPMPEARQEVFTLSHGEIVVQFPRRVDPADEQDVIDWWAIMLRKIQRCIGQAPDKDDQQPLGEPAESD